MFDLGLLGHLFLKFLLQKDIVGLGGVQLDARVFNLAVQLGDGVGEFIGALVEHLVLRLKIADARVEIGNLILGVRERRLAVGDRGGGRVEAVGKLHGLLLARRQIICQHQIDLIEIVNFQVGIHHLVGKIHDGTHVGDVLLLALFLNGEKRNGQPDHGDGQNDNDNLYLHN